MKKSLLALAVLGAFAGTASADTSNITVYGIVDTGISHIKAHDGTSTTSMGGGIGEDGSRLGFKGSEDLGGGLAVNFKLEMGIDTSNGSSAQGGKTFGRNTTVGLSGGFGSVSIGRQNDLLNNVLASFDPMDEGFTGTGDVGNLGNGAAAFFPTGAFRMDSSVVYNTPSMSGFTGHLAYGIGGVADNSAAGSEYGISADYSNGPLGLAVGYDHLRNTADTDTTKQWLVGGSYNFGPVTGYIGYGTNKTDSGSTDNRNYLLGVAIPVGAGTILLSYINQDDRTDNDINQHEYAIAYKYAMSKRTDLFAYYDINHKDGTAAHPIAEENAKEFAVGIEHRF